LLAFSFVKIILIVLEENISNRPSLDENEQYNIVDLVKQAYVTNIIMPQNSNIEF